MRSKQSKRPLRVGHSGLLEAELQSTTFWKHHLELILNDALAAAGHWPFADGTNEQASSIPTSTVAVTVTLAGSEMAHER